METTIEQVRRAAADVAAAIDARLILLFGSAARGDDRRPEDLDIGVLGCEGPIDAVDVTNRFIRRLETQAVDVTDLRRADPLLLMLAVRDGIPLHEDPPGEFARFVSLAARRYADTRKFREGERDEIREFVDGRP